MTENEIVTLAAPPTLPLPIISVTREPNPMVAGRDFTLRWSTTHTATLTRKCTAAIAGGFVSDGAMVIAAIDATTSTGSLPAAKADVNWVGKPSTCTWTATSKEGKTKEFTETMTTDAAPTGPQITYIHTDGLGSPVARTDEKGVIISRTRYEPYGATAGGTTPTIGFTGHVNDADTGLTYMQQRYYDPVAGRFMSVDPVLTDTNTGASFNRYTYANNSPYKFKDPDGRQIRPVNDPLHEIWHDPFSASYSGPDPCKQNSCLDSGSSSGATQSNSGSTESSEDTGPSCFFFCLTTFESMKRGATLETAVKRGVMFREFTGPTLIGATSLAVLPQGIGGSRAAIGGASALLVPRTLYHFTSARAAAGIYESGSINMSMGLYGRGVYATAFRSPLYAKIQGAVSTEVMFTIPTAGMHVVPTLWFGTYRFLENVPIR